MEDSAWLLEKQPGEETDEDNLRCGFNPFELFQGDICMKGIMICSQTLDKLTRMEEIMITSPRGRELSA